MYSVDPNVLIQMIRSGKNPQQLMLSVLQGQAYNNPLGRNLLSLAQQGRTEELEKVVRNIYTQQGGSDFDAEFEAFKRALGYNN